MCKVNDDASLFEPTIGLEIQMIRLIMGLISPSARVEPTQDCVLPDLGLTGLINT